MMKKFSIFFICCCLLFAAILPFAGCSSDTQILDKISPDDQDLVVVGSVGNKDILYDELRCLTLNYKKVMESTHGKGIWDNPITAETYRPMLEQYVYTALVSNAATVIAAEELGISIDDEEIKQYVLQGMLSLAEAIIDDIQIKNEDEEYSPGRKEINQAYKDYLEDNYLTDRYNRYATAVEGCVKQMSLKLIKDGMLSDDEQYIKDYIYKNFVRVLHVYVENDEGEDIGKNRDAAEKALEELLEGKITMKQLIGSKLNEDFYLTTMHGYYFTHGEYFEAYENAAFNLEIGEYSDVIASERGFYIIQRLELEDDYINENFETLKTQYLTAYVNSKIQEAKDSLEFVPNDYCTSLDLTKIK